MSLTSIRSLLRNSYLFNTGVKITSVRHRSHDDHHPNPGVMPPPNDHLNFRPALLDDLPKPEGDFYEDLRKRNRRYWRDFIIGAVYLSGTLYYLIYVQEFILWNAFPPEMPPKEERIKSFWVPPADEDEDDDDDDDDD